MKTNSPLTLRQRIGLELHRLQRHTNAQLHPLRSLFWECTLRCNMHCRHCGSDCRAMAEVADMPAADFLRAVDTLLPHLNPHELFVIITGGEALLRPDLEEVGRELYSREVPWGVVTNGYLLNAQRLESLMQAGLHSMSISLDGFAEQHNWIRCHPQAFERASEAIRTAAAEADLLWDVVSCVGPHNVDILPELKEYLVGLGVRRWRIFSIAPMGRAATEDSLQLDSTGLRRLMDFIADSRATDPRINVSYACEGFLGHYEQRVRDHFFDCRAGIEVASVLCDGSISGCTSIRSHMYQGNIYTDSLWEVWQNRFEAMRQRSWTRQGQCRGCKVYRYCEGSGLHLYDEQHQLLTCHYRRLQGLER